MPVSSLPAALLHHADLAGEEPWLFRSEGWDWRWHSWSEIARQVTARAGALSDLSPGSRAAFSYSPRPRAIILDLALQAAGLVSVPISGEREAIAEWGCRWVEVEEDEASALPHPRPSPLPLSRPPHPPPRERGDRLGRSGWSPSSPGEEGWEGTGEEGRGDEGLGRGDSGGVAVVIGGQPVEVDAAGLLKMGDEIQGKIAPPRRAGEREVVVLGGPLEKPEERAMLSWATRTGAAVALEPEPGLRIATAAWVRPTVFHGTAEEIAALRARVEKGRRRGLPFGRLRTVLVTGELPAQEEAAFWSGRGVKLGRV